MVHERVRVAEGVEVQGRFELAKKLMSGWRSEYRKIHPEWGGEWMYTKEEYDFIEGKVGELASDIGPQVWDMDYWSHVITSANMAGQYARKINESLGGNEILNPWKLHTLMLMHEAGRLVNSTHYRREELIGEKLQEAMGISEQDRSLLPRIGDLANWAKKVYSNESQVKGLVDYLAEVDYEDRERLEVQARADDVFLKELIMSDENEEIHIKIERLILRICDNLGKWDGNELFDLNIFFKYLNSQETRYGAKSLWPSIAAVMDDKRFRGNSEETNNLLRIELSNLQGYLVKRAMEFLHETFGASYGEIRHKIMEEDPRPKMMVMVRHGKVEDRYDDEGVRQLYNIDEVHRKLNLPVVELSQEGWEGMERVGEIIRNSHRLKPKKAYRSTAKRVFQSAKAAGFCESEEVKELNDRRCEQLMRVRKGYDEFVNEGGYGKERNEGNYHVLPELRGKILESFWRVETIVKEWMNSVPDDVDETRADATMRVLGVVSEIVKELSPGEVTAVFGHGDTTTGVLRTISGNYKIEVEKADAFVVIYKAGENNPLKPFAMYKLK